MMSHCSRDLVQVEPVPAERFLRFLLFRFCSFLHLNLRDHQHIQLIRRPLSETQEKRELSRLELQTYSFIFNHVYNMIAATSTKANVVRLMTEAATEREQRIIIITVSYYAATVTSEKTLHRYIRIYRVGHKKTSMSILHVI